MLHCTVHISWRLSNNTNSNKNNMRWAKPGKWWPKWRSKWYKEKNLCTDMIDRWCLSSHRKCCCRCWKCRLHQKCHTLSLSKSKYNPDVQDIWHNFGFVSNNHCVEFWFLFQKVLVRLKEGRNLFQLTSKMYLNDSKLKLTKTGGSDTLHCTKGDKQKCKNDQSLIGMHLFDCLAFSWSSWKKFSKVFKKEVQKNTRFLSFFVWFKWLVWLKNTGKLINLSCFFSISTSQHCLLSKQLTLRRDYGSANNLLSTILKPPVCVCGLLWDWETSIQKKVWAIIKSIFVGWIEKYFHNLNAMKKSKIELIKILHSLHAGMTVLANLVALYFSGWRQWMESFFRFQLKMMTILELWTHQKRHCNFVFDFQLYLYNVTLLQMHKLNWWYN